MPKQIPTTYVGCFEGEVLVDAYGRFPGATAKDLEALYKIAYAEAGIDGKKGMKAVVWSIERRTQHRQWKGMSLFDIISQAGQFDGYESKYYNSDLPKEVFKAVREAMRDKNEIPRNYVYFCNPKASTCGWFFDVIIEPQREKVIRIGRHDYYPDPKI